MSTRLQSLLEEIRELENRVIAEVAQEAEQFGYTIRQGRIGVEQEVARRQKLLATRIRTYLAQSSLLVMSTAPIVYSLLVPLMLLDLFTWLYQATCFPIYRIPKVRRGDYLLFDRRRLQYLNGIERTHCLYCSYANGLLAYVQEIAARTEQYWCPIKHAQRARGAHSRYYKFLSYGDAERYASDLERLRRDFSDLGRENPGQ